VLIIVAHSPVVLDMKRALGERDEELAAARETTRRLMNQLNQDVIGTAADPRAARLVPT
jgi:hypothetical protein